MATDISSLQTLFDNKNPTPKLAQSIKSYALEVDEIIDVKLPAIKSALESNKTAAQSNSDFSSTEIAVIDAAIARIDTALGI